MLLLRDCTNGERLLLERRRRRQSQRKAANRHGVTRYCYRQWEAGIDESGPRVPLQRLRPHEACFLLRRRAEIPLHKLARRMGISRWWLCQMEYGRESASRLVGFWNGPGAEKNGR